MRWEHEALASGLPGKSRKNIFLVSGSLTSVVSTDSRMFYYYWFLNCEFIFSGDSFIFKFILAKQHSDLSSLTRDRTLCPLHWEHRVLTVGPPGKSLSCF